MFVKIGKQKKARARPSTSSQFVRNTAVSAIPIPLDKNANTDRIRAFRCGGARACVFDQLRGALLFRFTRFYDGYGTHARIIRRLRFFVCSTKSGTGDAKIVFFSFS